LWTINYAMSKLAVIRIVLSFLAAILMYLLWSESQKPWCGQDRWHNYEGTAGLPLDSSAPIPGQPGYRFFFGGSMVVLFCAIWTAAGPFLKGSGSGGAPLVVVWAPSVLGVIALTRLKFFIDAEAAVAPKGTRSHPLGYGIWDAGENCIRLVLALLVVAAAYTVVGWWAKRKAPTPPAPAS
jgi:hypothetical protein